MDYETVESIDNALQDLLMGQEEAAILKLNKIINLLPIEFRDLIEQAFLFKRIPKEYMLSAILFSISTSIGLTFYIKALGYKNYGNCYFTIIGSRGDAKSEAIKIATKPIKEMDDKDYENYQDEMKVQLDNELPPKRKQILIQNASIEAAHKVHSDNPNSVGIAIDEIFALVERMSNSSSRDGIAWRNFFLEGYTNGHVDVSRKTTESFRIKETYPTLIGGLQHQFLPKLFANGNLESGFIDRQFFTPKLTSNNRLIRGEIAPEVNMNYNTSIHNILSYKRQSELIEEPLKQFEICLTDVAAKRLFNYTQDLINRQLSARPIIKEYMSKMQISIQKLCVLVFMMEHSFKKTFANKLNEKNVDLAIELNEFYFNNFQAIIDISIEQNDLKPTIDGVIKLAKENNASQKSVAEITGAHKSTISKKWNKS